MVEKGDGWNTTDCANIMSIIRLHGFRYLLVFVSVLECSISFRLDLFGIPPSSLLMMIDISVGGEHDYI